MKGVKNSAKLAATQPFLIDKHNYNSLEQNFGSEFQSSLPKTNNQGFLSDLEEFMNMNYNTTATDSKGAIARSSMSANSFQNQKKLAIQKLKYIRKQKKNFLKDI